MEASDNDAGIPVQVDPTGRQLQDGVRRATACDTAQEGGVHRPTACAGRASASRAYHRTEESVQLLLDCISQAAGKAIVIVPYKAIIEVLKKTVSQMYSCEVVNGDVSKVQRDRIFTAFKHDTDPQVLLCHPEVMAHGLNLTEADRTIFYGPIDSNNEDQQVIERFNRHGQTRKMTITRIGAHPLEWAVYDKVEGQKEAQETMLDLYKNEMLGV